MPFFMNKLRIQIFFDFPYYSFDKFSLLVLFTQVCFMYFGVIVEELFEVFCLNFMGKKTH